MSAKRATRSLRTGFIDFRIQESRGANESSSNWFEVQPEQPEQPTQPPARPERTLRVQQLLQGLLEAKGCPRGGHYY